MATPPLAIIIFPPLSLPYSAHIIYYVKTFFISHYLLPHLTCGIIITHIIIYIIDMSHYHYSELPAVTSYWLAMLFLLFIYFSPHISSRYIITLY